MEEEESRRKKKEERSSTLTEAKEVGTDEEAELSVPFVELLLLLPPTPEGVVADAKEVEEEEDDEVAEAAEVLMRLRRAFQRARKFSSSCSFLVEKRETRVGGKLLTMMTSS